MTKLLNSLVNAKIYSIYWDVKTKTPWPAFLSGGW